MAGLRQITKQALHQQLLLRVEPNHHSQGIHIFQMDSSGVAIVEVNERLIF